MKKQIYIAGHKGMVGAEICRKLKKDPQNKIITANRSELDLENQKQTEEYFEKSKFDEVYLCAARVGGIMANQTFPASFIYSNLAIQQNVIHFAYKYNVKRLLFLGSSCIYPKYSRQPIEEGELLKGKLEPTNEPYAIAKIAGIKMCQAYNRQYNTDFRSVMPTNSFGPGDHYDLNTSHVLPALIAKLHAAKINNLKYVELWGTGQAMREFIYVEDLASACIHIMNLSKKEYKNITENNKLSINIGSGQEYSIKELAVKVSEVVNYHGEIIFDHKRPDGTPRKLLNSDKLFKSGWKPSNNFQDALKKTYLDYTKKLKNMLPEF